ncbi:MAG: hypothetical protein JSU77_10000 [Fidelibacterota bacterium]|nr:MAG: hypothetical protein JSU77_10000 [Candidatus Neomarinimicrobiota bacterium]
MSVASSIQEKSQNLPAAIPTAGIDDLASSRRYAPGAGADNHWPWGNRISSLPDIRTWVEDQLIFLQETITTLLRRLPAKAEGELTLLVGPDGNITAVGDHPYRHALLDYFNSCPELLDDFASLAATASFLHEADNSLEFKRAHRKNPEAAINQYQHLLRRYTFGLRILGGFVTPTYFEPAAIQAILVTSGTDHPALP